MKTTINYDSATICGRDVWYDASGGQGHRWVDITADNCPVNVAEEIAAEICEHNYASESQRMGNGQYYRWRE